jgi:hypothetical protein
MRKEQLPELEARGDPPAGAVRIRAGDARAVLVAVAMADIRLGEGEARLRDEELLAVHGVAPFCEGEQRDGVRTVRHAVVPVCRAVCGDVEASVDVGHEGGVSDARLAEGGDARGPTAGGEVEGGNGGDGAAEGVADEDELVRGVRGDGGGQLREDGFACVQPRRVEAGVDGAVGALWRVGGRWVGGGGRGIGREEVGGCAIIVVARVGDVFLRDGGQVDDGVGERVGAAEGEDDARARGRVRQSDVAAGVAEERARVPRLGCVSCHALAMRNGDLR